MACWCYFVLTLSLVFRLNYLFARNYDVDDLSDLISNILGNIETILKILSFYVYGTEYNFLINEMARKLRQGNWENFSENSYRDFVISGTWMTANSFWETVESVKKFINVMKVLGIVITSSYLILPLYNFIFLEKRIYPFKME